LPDLFLYSDFRKFLSDYYDEQKERNPNFSYQIFSDKIGFGNKGLIFNIIKGIKPLSSPGIYKIISGLKINGAEKEYFEALVHFNQAKDEQERSRFYKELQRIRDEEPRDFTAYCLKNEQFGIYSCWYHCVVRSLIDMYKFNGDYAWLAKKVYPNITEKQAQESVYWLQKLGLIQKNSDGSYEVTNKTITTGKEKRMGVLNFHYETLELARKSLGNIPNCKRNVTGLTIGISQKMYLRICDEIQYFQKRLLALAENDDDADRVYQLNFHFFPLSQLEDDHE